MNKNSTHSNRSTFSLGSFLPSPSIGWISVDGAYLVNSVHGDILVNWVRSLSEGRDESRKWN